MNAVVFFGYILGGIMLSIIITPVFVQRYIAVVLPFLWLFVIFTFLVDDNNKIYIAAIIVVVPLLVYNYYLEYSWKFIDNEDNSSLYYSFKDEVGKEDIIFHDNAHSLSIMSVYMPDNESIITEEYIEVEKFKDWEQLSPNIDVQKEFNIPDVNTVWVILSDEDESVLDYLSSKGYKTEERGEKIQ